MDSLVKQGRAKELKDNDKLIVTSSETREGIGLVFTKMDEVLAMYSKE